MVGGVMSLHRLRRLSLPASLRLSRLRNLPARHRQLLLASRRHIHRLRRQNNLRDGCRMLQDGNNRGLRHMRDVSFSNARTE